MFCLVVRVVYAPAVIVSVIFFVFWSVTAGPMIYIPLLNTRLYVDVVMFIENV